MSLEKLCPIHRQPYRDERAGDRLATKATPEGTLSYTYYASGNVETIASSNTNGVSVTLTWDELNRLSTVIDNRLPSGANTAVYTYDPAGNVATVAYPNGFQTTFTYDQLSRLTAVSTPVSSYSYQLGPTGNRIGAAEGNGRTLTWNYDGIYRLTSETISGDPANNSGDNGSATYTLDAVGNRTAASSSFSGFSPVAGSYNADDQLSSETYDANGNTTLAANGNSYTYDSENHMTSATGNGNTITMVYDAFGNRVGKTVNGVTTWYLVEDDVNPTDLPQVMEEKVGGAVQRVYTYGLQRISQYQFFDNQWTASFYVYDGAGSVRQLTDSNGTPTDEYEYDAYGNSFTKQGTTPNNYLYRGEQYDSDLGLYYLRARYYNPGTGRFMSRDPEDGIDTDPKTLHKYNYAGGDPVNAIDPTGRATIPFPAPAPQPKSSAGAGFEYALLITAIAIEAIPAEKALACALKTAYDYVAKSVAAMKLAIPNPSECRAECPPCDPPAGTQCYESHSGHTHNGWDPHYRIWIQNQDQNTCKCFWNKQRGTTGVTQFPPAGLECSSYPTWPWN
jgi:RHS repeat-associated protein